MWKKKIIENTDVKDDDLEPLRVPATPASLRSVEAPRFKSMVLSNSRR